MHLLRCWWLLTVSYQKNPTWFFWSLDMDYINIKSIRHFAHLIIHNVKIQFDPLKKSHSAPTSFKKFSMQKFLMKGQGFIQICKPHIWETVIITKREEFKNHLTLQVEIFAVPYEVPKILCCTLQFWIIPFGFVESKAHTHLTHTHTHTVAILDLNQACRVRTEHYNNVLWIIHWFTLS